LTAVAVKVMVCPEPLQNGMAGEEVIDTLATTETGVPALQPECRYRFRCRCMHSRQSKQNVGSMGTLKITACVSCTRDAIIAESVAWSINAIRSIANICGADDAVITIRIETHCD